MLIRSIASILLVAASCVLVIGQTPDANKNKGKPTTPLGSEKLRNVPFSAGVDLQFLIKELAREMDFNVLFDPESFRAPRRTVIDLQNVTTALALNYILLQEGLFSEEVGPRTIMVASQARRPNGIPQMGVGVFYLTDQLAKYFAVEGGILINNVLPDSPASRSGLKAGDVIVEMDGLAVTGAFGFLRALNEKKDGDVVLKIVRESKSQTVSLTPQRGIQ
jgi:membrane-associated protease RseP (regulator of RpoE activity)